MILIIGNCNIITRETAAAILGYVVTTVDTETGTGGIDPEEEIGTVDPEEEIGTVDLEEEIGTVDLEEETGTVIMTVLWTPLDPVVGIPGRGIVAMMEGVHGTNPVIHVGEKTLSIQGAAGRGHRSLIASRERVAVGIGTQRCVTFEVE